ncbi:MAG: ABC transporter substrate-binding protein [Caldilineaceae bacterium]
MNRKLYLWLSLLVVASLVLAACGGSGGGGSQPAAEATATTAPAPTEAPKATDTPAASQATTSTVSSSTATTSTTAVTSTTPATSTAATTGTAATTSTAAVTSTTPTTSTGAVTSTAATSGTQGAASSGEKVTVTWIGAGPGAEAEFDKKEIAEFEKANPNISIKFVEGPVSATDRYGLYLQNFQAKSAAVDVYQIDVIWPGDLAEHLLDLNQYGGADAVKDDFKAIVTNNTVGGKLVGLPWFTDGGLLYYRTDLLQKYGYTAPPKDWKELADMAKKIQDGERAAGNQDFWGFVWQGKGYEGLTCDALEWIYSNGGGTIVSPDKKITINNDKAAAALDQAAGWIGAISPPGVTGFQEEESRAVWQGGNAAFMRNWPYAYSLGQGADSKIVGKFDVTTLPAGDAGHGAATLGGWQLAVSKYSAHPAEAAKFALFLASKEQQKARAINISLLPTNATLYDDPDVAKASPFMPKLKNVFTSAVARPSTASAPKYNEVSTIFFQAVSNVLTKKSNGADAVANMELDLKDKLGYDTAAP